MITWTETDYCADTLAAPLAAPASAAATDLNDYAMQGVAVAEKRMQVAVAEQALSDFQDETRKALKLLANRLTHAPKGTVERRLYLATVRLYNKTEGWTRNIETHPKGFFDRIETKATSTAAQEA